ncbi:MAG: 7-carboxy-7-deazaguanine synthase QueE [Planctomycetota bacterium]
MTKAPLIEVFGSIQGEGRFCGEPMVFVRTATCPIRCDYCDTENSYRAPNEVPIGDGPLEMLRNPVRVEEATRAVLRCWRALGFDEHTAPSVSLTGGEPLQFAEFGRQLGAALPEGSRFHLETAALDPDSLVVVLPALTHLSADHKLPSSLQGPGNTISDFGEKHRLCVEHALDAGLTVDLKIVVTSTTGLAELESALNHHRPAAGLEVVLQPVTPIRGLGAPSSEQLDGFVRAVTARRFPVRVLPQLHPRLGLR